MEDRDLMEKELLLVKGSCDLFLHGTEESTTAEVHSAFKDALNTCHNNRRVKDPHCAYLVLFRQ